MSLKRQMSWKSLLSRRKKSTGGGYASDDDNISIDSTTSAFPSFEAKHFSKWKSKWRQQKEKSKGDGDELSICSTTSAFTSSKFPTPAWTTKFYANKFLKKRGLSKTNLSRGSGPWDSENEEGEEAFWAKDHTLKHQNSSEQQFHSLKKTLSLHSMGVEECSVVIQSSANVFKVPPRRSDMPICWEPLRKRERLSKKKDILSQLWRSKSSIRRVNALILEYLDLFHFNICRLVCKDWMELFDCYYPRRLQREWQRYHSKSGSIKLASSESYDKEKNPFYI